MMMFILWVCGGLLVVLAPGHCALKPCKRVDDCACVVDGGKQIDIRSLGYQGKKAPRFPYAIPDSGSQYWEYAYNPCYDFTDENCKGVIACQKGGAPPKTEAFGLGSASSAKWGISQDTYTITYTDGKREAIIELVCDEKATEPKVKVLGPKDASKDYFYFTLTSKCACPGGCENAPTKGPPTNEPPSGGGIGIGSIMCIVFSVLVIVYFVGGVLFMKFGRHAEGREVIPNVGLWTKLPGTIKDGAKFSVSFFRRGGKYDEL